MEKGIEHEQPNDDTGRAQLEHTLHNRTERQLVKGADRVAQSWRGVLLDQKVHHAQAGQDLEDTLDEKRLAEDGGAWVGRLVAESRSEPKVTNVRDRNIVRVLHVVGKGLIADMRFACNIVNFSEVVEVVLGQIKDVGSAQILVDKSVGGHLEKEDASVHEAGHGHEGVEDHEVGHERRPSNDEEHVEEMQPADHRLVGSGNSVRGKRSLSLLLWLFVHSSCLG